MNKFYALVCSILFFITQSGFTQNIPQLGIASPLANDSVLYSSGFKLIGESVSRMVSPRLSEEQFQKNIKLVKAAKCEVYMCNVFFPGDMKIAGDQVNEKVVLGFADTVFNRASKLGLTAIVLGSGAARKLPEGYDKKKAQQDFVILGKKLANLAQKHGVKIFLENLNSTETNFITSLKDAAIIVKQINHPNFRLNADIYHMLKENESPQEIINAGSIIEYCEIAEKDERTAPGVKGDDFVPYLKALKAIGFKGPIFIEGRWNNMAKEAPAARAYLENQLKEAYL
jgi:sugar phosphate isomerase/epimerase